MNAVHRKRLLNVARALRESPAPRRFTMGSYGHPCGTPACALGHYAARRDLQRALSLSCDGVLHSAIPWESEWSDRYADQVVLEHFGIDRDEAEALFGPDGCGLARGPKGAARYIERFVQRHTP